MTQAPLPTKLSLLLMGLLCLLMSACKEEVPINHMEEMRNSGKLIILTRNAPTTYYEGRDGEWEGFEHDLATAFAEHLKLEPEFVVMDSTAAILEAIQNNEGHVACAGLSRTPEREASYLFGPSYMTVREELVCSGTKPAPKSLGELQERSIAVAADSSYEEKLKELRYAYPNLTWTATFEEETEQLMDRVWQDEIDCTIADSNIIEINRRYFPELQVSLKLSDNDHHAWVFAPGVSDLLPIAEQWFAAAEQKWLVDELKERYFGHVELFDYVNIKRFNRRVRERLPKYEETFKAAAERFDVNWTLLAAQAYQESHWRRNARSPTGVRGMMMLTQRTARQLGVIDRTDPTQSIMGGARYFSNLRERLPESITEPDRTWIALAAYNVGMGHVFDARQLAEEQGLNPDSWRDLQKTLPLLAKPKYYKKLRHGYARGREPVRYVQRIRDFRDLLEKRLSEQPLQAAGVDEEG